MADLAATTGTAAVSTRGGVDAQSAISNRQSTISQLNMSGSPGRSMSGPGRRPETWGQSSAYRLALLFNARVPADNRRLAGHGLVKDGFRRSDLETGPDKGRQEAVELHVRESRHATLAARSLSKRTDTGNRVRIIVKGFVEVPDAQ